LRGRCIQKVWRAATLLLDDTVTPALYAAMTIKSALVWCPFPNREAARSVSGQLLEMKLIACANIGSEMESVFDWNGKVDTSIEVPVLFKTSGATLEQLVEQLGDLHPYEEPAVIRWYCDEAHPSTRAWLASLNLGGSA